jgi:hypothetical protein
VLPCFSIPTRSSLTWTRPPLPPKSALSHPPSTAIAETRTACRPQRHTHAVTPHLPRVLASSGVIGDMVGALAGALGRGDEELAMAVALAMLQASAGPAKKGL